MYILYHTFINKASTIFLRGMILWIDAGETYGKIF